MTRVAVAALRSAAGYLRTDFKEWRPRHLQAGITAVVDESRLDLDQLFLVARQRSLLDRLGFVSFREKFAESSGARMKLRPQGVGDDILGGPRHVKGDDVGDV